MAYQKKTPMTAEERAALAPALQEIEHGYEALESGMRAIRHVPDEDDQGGGFCGLCTCSSFLGDRKSPRAICQRPFCKHRLAVHLT